MKQLLFPPSHKNPRSLALQVLLQCHSKEVFAPEALDRALSRAILSGLDRKLATQLVYGVLRRRNTLDTLIKTAATRRRDQVEPWLWECLRLGVYQLALLTHIPAHAAIFETVELAQAVGKPRGKGFLNGVLRKVASLVTDEVVDAPARNALPLDEGSYRQLARDVLPDPKENPVEYLSAGFSWPGWLAQRWLNRYGWEECLRLGFWFNQPAALYLRCNTLTTDRATILQAFADAGIKAEPGRLDVSIRLVDHVPIFTLPGYARGWFAVQDESAMRVAEALAPEPGMQVLDLCAAPGSKTTHMAELMQNQGSILACDVQPNRLRQVEELCGRLGVTIIKTCLLDQAKNEEPPNQLFDAVLADVPCSNTGVLGRRPEVRWRLKPGDIEELVILQTKLLLQAAERIRPGGAIVYSTCSIEPEENQGVVQVVLQAIPNLALEAEETQVPGQPADGGYWARLRRKG